MLGWFTDNRRRKLMANPFSTAWEEILQHNVAYYRLLTDAEREHLRGLIQVFIVEKDWEGCGGLELTDEIRVTISAQACLLILNLPHNYYYEVVYHEFAHKLDMLDGAADGTPPLRNRTEYRDWVQTCSHEYLRLRQEVEQGRKTFLNSYGAVNEAEFFAVATEQFFDQPREMIKHSPDLYRVLCEYYRQDPAQRLRMVNAIHIMPLIT